MRSITTEPHINTVVDVGVIGFSLIISLLVTFKLIRMYNAKFWALYFLLSLYHYGFTVFYYLKTKANVSGDSAHYYMRIVAPENYYDPTIKFGFSSNFIKSIVNVFYQSLNLSYLSFFFIFSTLGFIGFYYCAKIIRYSGFDKRNKYLGLYIMPLVLFLPNQHMWTVALGKDSLMFFGLMMFTFALTNIRKHILIFCIASFLIFMVRPHVFIMAVSAIGLSTFLEKKNFNVRKLVMLFFFGVIGYFALRTLTIVVLKIPFTPSAIASFVESREGLYVKMDYSGSMVDTSGYPFPYKLFSYLYRPLFDKINFNYIIIGIDNILSIILSLAILKKGFFKWFLRAPLYIRFSFVFFIISSSFFALIFSNFGIAVRQKTQFIFSLYIVLLAFISWKYERKSDNRKIAFGES